MRRRDVLSLLGGAAASWPWSARAQQANRSVRIGVLTLASQSDDEHLLAALVEGLHTHGYVQGRNLVIDYRYTDGDVKRLARLAQELIGLKPDVLVGAEPSAARALKRAAPNLPIVCPQLTDALIPELAASYARPGGSVTGVAQTVEGLTGKLVELAHEFVPGALRVGFLKNPTGASMQYFSQGVEDAARQRGILLLTEEVTTPEGLTPAIERLASQKVEALVIPVNGLFRNEAARIAQRATAARLPTIFAQRQGVEVGGLASYGTDQRESFRRAADYVDKIIKGANPGELPIEFPTKIDLVINLKAAKALGLDVPSQLQQRADEVIE
jgi:putative ABC transport system substrate-binding protein